jgi:hypothetical protein
MLQRQRWVLHNRTCGPVPASPAGYRNGEKQVTFFKCSYEWLKDGHARGWQYQLFQIPMLAVR